MKKILATLVTCLMILTVLLTSCGNGEETGGKVIEEGGGQSITTSGETEKTETPTEKESISQPSGAPIYGGTLRAQGHFIQMQFNPFNFSHVLCGNVYVTNEGLIEGDWTKGPAGTNENDFLNSFGGRIDLMTGILAESWEFPDEETIVFHIRPGIHFWDKPPVNGREFTAEDAAWTMEALFASERSYYAAFTQAGNNPTSIKAVDKYTVEVKLPPEVVGVMLFEIGDRMYYFPAGITEQVDLNDWKNAIGTGPWMLVDYVPDNSITYDRNPNYWKHDPMHPDNQLPYPDKWVHAIIADASTTQAAFRTGKIDALGNQTYENWELFMQQCPALSYIQTYPDMPSVLVGRMDKPELPFDDIKVRQALNMAINRQEIIDDYYGGYADMLSYPVCNAKVFEPIYRPLEEYPESVQMLFEYNPERAKELLEEAGYPDGFQTKVQCDSNNADFLSLIQVYFQQINVEMQIEVLETSVMRSIGTARSHDEMITAITKSSVPFMLLTERETQLDCKSMWTHPLANEYYEKISAVLGKNDEEVIRLLRELAPHLLESAWGVWLPVPYMYTMWWPWLNNYYGVQDLGYCNQHRVWTFVWVDEGLKQSMGY